MTHTFETAAEIAIAAQFLLDAARPIASVLPCTTVRREDLTALRVAVEMMDLVLDVASHTAESEVRK